MNRLQSIDILRGLACLAVLFSHISRVPGTGSHWMHTILFMPMDFGYLGVPLFLLISGFCIHSSAARSLAKNCQPNVDWISFWKRRFWRLYPPYLVMIAISILVYYSFPSNDPYKIVNLPFDVATHLFMIHNLFHDYSFSLGNGPFWTLALEEQLYAFYLAVLLLRRRLSCRMVLLIACSVSLLWRLILPLVIGQKVGYPPLEFGTFQAWPFSYWGFWVAGAVAAESHAGAISLPKYCFSYRVMAISFTAGLLTSTITLGRVLDSNTLRDFTPVEVLFFGKVLVSLADPAFFGLGLFVLMNKLLRLEKLEQMQFRGAGLLARIGVISYSLYLTHVPVLRVLESSLPIENSIPGTLLRYSIYAPICLLTAMIFFYIVERHFLSSVNRAKQQELAVPGT